VTIENNGPAPAQDTASVLFGMDGVEVTEAEREAGGRLAVWARITLPAVCPGCGTVSEKVHQYVTVTPRDVRACGQDTDFFLVKRRMKCAEEGCPAETFTEPVPQLPPRCTITRRLPGHAGAEVADRGITPAEAARDAGISWPSAHAAFAARADETLDGEPAPVAHPGIDEHRRGRPRWRQDTDTGEYVQLADRWHVCFHDLDGNQGLLGQVEGRSAVRRMLPGARIAVDLFHVVQLAVKTASDVRRRAIREKYGRRGKAGDPGYGIKRMLMRNLENLSAEQFEKVIDILDASAEGQQVAIAWIAKEKLRDALKLRARVTGSTPCERQVRDRLFTFYDWCAQNEDIPELQTLANTIARWENEIVTAVVTGVTNATAESLNRLAKLEARRAYGFRNPANQRRRVRIACTRGTRRPSTRITSTTQGVSKRQQHHG
jgi:transposase